jgi:hypothetical protein
MRPTKIMRWEIEYDGIEEDFDSASDWECDCVVTSERDAADVSVEVEDIHFRV